MAIRDIGLSSAVLQGAGLGLQALQAQWSRDLAREQEDRRAREFEVERQQRDNALAQQAERFRLGQEADQRQTLAAQGLGAYLAGGEMPAPETFAQLGPGQQQMVVGERMRREMQRVQKAQMEADLEAIIASDWPIQVKESMIKLRMNRPGVDLKDVFDFQNRLDDKRRKEADERAARMLESARTARLAPGGVVTAPMPAGQYGPEAPVDLSGVPAAGLRQFNDDLQREQAAAERTRPLTQEEEDAAVEDLMALVPGLDDSRARAQVRSRRRGMTNQVRPNVSGETRAPSLAADREYQALQLDLKDAEDEYQSLERQRDNIRSAEKVAFDAAVKSARQKMKDARDAMRAHLRSGATAAPTAPAPGQSQPAAADQAALARQALARFRQLYQRDPRRGDGGDQAAIDGIWRELASGGGGGAR